MGPRAMVHRVGRKAHNGEVKASIWDDETIDACAAAGDILL